MPSTFTWLDYSEQERRKMLDVIELFGERTTRDELGLGGVRDAFADMLFPGTSTIQTRAKYFLFVPWIYRSLEVKSTPSASIGVKARALEIKLIDALSQSKDKDTAGLIGKQAKENLQRLPSSVYWQGLLTWGIRQFRGSQDEYHRSLDLFYNRRNAHGHSRRDFEGETMGESGPANWHAGLPAVPDNFPSVASFALGRHEAEYLRERVLAHCSKSLLALLVRERIAVDPVGFAWQLPGDLPPHLREQLEHGWNFSLSVHGAQLLYNLMLAELRKTEERTEHYRARMSLWWEAVSDRKSVLEAWDRTRFWDIVNSGNPRVSPRAKRFVNDWIDAVQTATRLADVRDSQALRHLIEIREVQLKGGLARLKNQRALELWPGAAGDGQLDLRWRSAKGILMDLMRGLEGAAHA
jgi:hypothetical protein